MPPIKEFGYDCGSVVKASEATFTKIVLKGVPLDVFQDMLCGLSFVHNQSIKMIASTREGKGGGGEKKMHTELLMYLKKKLVDEGPLLELGRMHSRDDGYAEAITLPHSLRKKIVQVAISHFVMWDQLRESNKDMDMDFLCPDHWQLNFIPIIPKVWNKGKNSRERMLTVLTSRTSSTIAAFEMGGMSGRKIRARGKKERGERKRGGEGGSASAKKREEDKFFFFRVFFSFFYPPPPLTFPPAFPLSDNIHTLILKMIRSMLFTQE